MKHQKTNYQELNYYSQILSQQEITSIGLIIKQFEKNEITYQELKKILKNQNIELKPDLRDIYNIKTIKELKEFENRIINETYHPKDLHGYIISNNNYKNILIRYDRVMIEALAKHGDKEARKILNNLIAWEKEPTNQQPKRKLLNFKFNKKA